MRGSNPQPLAHKTNTLPTELIGQLLNEKNGGTAIRARVKRITTAYANHYTIPPATNGSWEKKTLFATGTDY